MYLSFTVPIILFHRSTFLSGAIFFCLKPFLSFFFYCWSAADQFFSYQTSISSLLCLCFRKIFLKNIEFQVDRVLLSHSENILPHRCSGFCLASIKRSAALLIFCSSSHQVPYLLYQL